MCIRDRVPIYEKFVTSYVWSFRLYACERRTLQQNTKDCINAHEMRLYRLLLRISWASHTTNDSVLNRVAHEPQLLATIKRKIFAYRDMYKDPYVPY